MKSGKRINNQAVGDTSNLNDKIFNKKWLNRVQLVTLILVPLIIIISIVSSLTFILYKFNSEIRMVKEKFDDNFIKFKKDSINGQIDQMRSSFEKIKRYAVLENNIEQQMNIIEDEMYNLIPKGFVYTQLPGQKEPKKLWPQFDWISISHLYLINENDTWSLDRQKMKDKNSGLDTLQKKRRLVLEDKMQYKKDLSKTDHLQSNYFYYTKSPKIIKLWQRL